MTSERLTDENGDTQISSIPMYYDDMISERMVDEKGRSCGNASCMTQNCHVIIIYYLSL
jgi:hypothetical protein